MSEERKLVTILFADIVGSTAATASEDPEIVRRTMQRAFGEMRELLTAHGGTVEKFIGDAVMCVFGVPQAHDDDAERAVRSAFALRGRIEELSSTLAFPLQLRIGVNTGRVVTGSEGSDTLVTGAPVNAAARLQQAATPGEIVVGEVTHGLTRGAVRYAMARSIEAKGLGTIQAHPAEELLDAVPQQHRGLGALRAPLIGRDAELRLLRESWRRTSEEKAPSLVTIYGQAGVGKSRLVGELIEVIGAGNVLRGRCLSYGSGITYWALQEMIRSDAGVVGDDAVAVASAKVRAAVLRAFGEASEDAESVAQRLLVVAGLATAEATLPGVGGDDLAREIRWAVRRYVEKRALASPIALVFDDIHWAEPELLDLIEHLAERARAPLFIACLARPDLRERRQTWGGGLTNAAAIQLEPLGATETRRLIAALLAIDDLAEDLRAEIVGRAEGNPLYVEELLRMLLESGQVAQRDGRFVATGDVRSLAIPPTLEGLLAARLDQLDPSAKRAVRIASVVGHIFYPGALVALGMASTEVDDALTRAGRRDLVFELDDRGPDGRTAYSFKHILVRDAAYESLPKGERWQLHDGVGRWLEGLSSAGDLAGIVAYHAERAHQVASELREEAAPALGRRALDLLLVQGRRALERGARATVLLDIYGRALRVADEIRAPEQERVEALAESALAREWIEGKGARLQVIEALEAARSAGPSAALVHLLIDAQEWQTGGHERNGVDLGDEALEAARRVGDADLIVLAKRWRAEPLHWLGRLSEAKEVLRDVLAEARSLGSTRYLSWILRGLERESYDTGDFAAATEANAEREKIVPVTERGRKIEPHARKMNYAYRTGDLTSAVTAGRIALDAGSELADERDLVWIRLVLTHALFDLDRLDEALGEGEKALRTVEHQGVRGFIGEFRQLYARMLLALGRLDGARVEAERAYGEIGDDDPVSRSSTSITLGLVREAEGKMVEAERLLREAIVVTGEYRSQETRARIDLGRFFLRHGRPAEARAELERARDFYVLPYAKGWRDRVEELLRQCDLVAAT